MPGIRIAHRTARSGILLVPILSKPFPGPFDSVKDKCPTCHQVHMTKTVHLWLDADGTCIVSAGVLEDLRLAGMPGLAVMAEVLNPPPLQIGAGRAEVDNGNRKIVRLGTPTHT
jgi:hypothetical protein